MFERKIVFPHVSQEIRNVIDAVMIVWVFWSIPSVFFRKAEIWEFVGVVWEMLQTFILLTFPIFAVLTNVVNWNLEVLIVTPALLVSIGVVSLVDASLTNILEVANNENPDWLRILLNSLQIMQGLILVFMGLYYTNGFWAGEYYEKLLNFLTTYL